MPYFYVENIFCYYFFKENLLNFVKPHFPYSKTDHLENQYHRKLSHNKSRKKDNLIPKKNTYWVRFTWYLWAWGIFFYCSLELPFYLFYSTDNNNCRKFSFYNFLFYYILWYIFSMGIRNLFKIKMTSYWPTIS